MPPNPDGNIESRIWTPKTASPRECVRVYTASTSPSGFASITVLRLSGWTVRTVSGLRTHTTSTHALQVHNTSSMPDRPRLRVRITKKPQSRKCDTHAMHPIGSGSRRPREAAVTAGRSPFCFSVTSRRRSRISSGDVVPNIAGRDGAVRIALRRIRPG